MKKYLSLADAARFLGVSYYTVKNLSKDGGPLAHARIDITDRIVKFETQVLIDFRESRRGKAHA